MHPIHPAGTDGLVVQQAVLAPRTNPKFLPELDLLDWAFYAWLRGRHLDALGALARAELERRDLLSRHGAEDAAVSEGLQRMEASRREEVASALAEGREPPAETPIEAPTPATGPVAREIQRNEADAFVAEHVAAVELAAGQALWALPRFLYELRESAETTKAARLALYLETEGPLRKAERKLRERFHRDSRAKVPDGDRCEHCRLAGVTELPDHRTWWDTGEGLQIKQDVEDFERWLLGSTQSDVTAWPRPREVYVRPLAFEQRIAAIAVQAGVGGQVPEIVIERPGDEPSAEEIVAMSDVEREALFTARLLDPAPASAIHRDGPVPFAALEAVAA